MFKSFFNSLIFRLCLLMLAIPAFGQQSLWVGQSYTFDVSSSVMGITANMSWSTSGGYLSLTGSGHYRNIQVTQYFSGTATVTCEWDYKLTSSGSYTHTKRQVTITCKDNQVSIYPTSLTMSPGETKNVSYSHQYNNEYTSAAQAYYTSQDPSVCTVSSTGEVKAVGPGTTYINVYSKISSISPYCLVTVNKIAPTAISLPSEVYMEGGQTKTITPTLTPSNANTTLSWSSSNTDVVTVDNGYLTAYKEGEAYVTVKTDNGLEAQSKIIVSKGKLSIFSSQESGWVENNTSVTLSSSQSGSTIYYTIDKSNPTTSSSVYTEPIIIDKNTTIKAFAVKEGFYDSDIETFEYKIRDFVIQDMFPEEGTTVNNFIIPYVTFNYDLNKSANFDNISLTDSRGEVVSSRPFIYQNQIFIAPLEELDVFLGYTVNIPENAFTNVENESNKSFSFSFDTGKKITKISFGYENSWL